jgi:type II secretory pathway pseudopilin PulG
MKTQIIIGVILLVVGYGLGRYVQPAKVVTKTQTVTQVVTQIQEHVHTVTHTVVQPNGIKDITTVTDNNSTENKDSDTKSSSSTITTYSKPQWRAQGLAGLNLSNVSTPIYGLGVERRILGPIFVGAYGKTNSEAGLSLSLEF